MTETLLAEDEAGGREVLLLAAVDRAVRHLPGHRATATRDPHRCSPGAPLFAVAEELGYAAGTSQQRELRTELDALAEGGKLERESWSRKRCGR